MRLSALAFAVVVIAAAPALAQDEWEDLGEASYEEDGLKDADPEPVAPAPATPLAAAPAPGDVETMKLVSAGTSAALLAFTGTGLGVALAFTNGALWSLMPNATFKSMEVPIWLGFWTLPALGAAGGAAFGALPHMEPTGVGVVSAAAAGGAGLGALMGWGFGYGLAILLHGPPPALLFPTTTKPAWSGTMATGILLGAGLGAATGAAVAAPFFVPGVLEAMSGPQE